MVLNTKLCEVQRQIGKGFHARTLLPEFTERVIEYVYACFSQSPSLGCCKHEESCVKHKTQVDSGLEFRGLRGVWELGGWKEPEEFRSNL